MKPEFIDRSEVLFGRGPDLAYLIERTERSGVTAVVGRAQMGKSWLLTELARRLAQPPPPSMLGRQQCLVGFMNAVGETSEFLFQRAVVDLYSRWLSDSSYLEQAKVVYQQQKSDLIGRTGEAVGSLFKELSKLGPKPFDVVGGLVEKTFHGLASANRDLLSGGSQLPRLQIEQGRDLLTIVHEITRRPLTLIFDQWEKSLGAEMETNLFDSYLREREEWPPCHIFLGLRPGGKPQTMMKQLAKDFPGPAEIYDLPPMHLDDGESGDALLLHLRSKVAAAGAVSDEDLLEMLAGYPGTVNRWTSSYNAPRLQSAEGLQEVADDANAYRYAEFDALLPSLSESERLLGIRLALLPGCGSAENWRALRNTVLEDVKAKDLDGLKRLGILESSAPPTYGHAKRTDAALQWFTENCYEELRETCELLIFDLGSRVRDMSPEAVPYVSGLAELDPFASRFGLSIASQSLCQAALSLFDTNYADPERLLEGARELSQAQTASAPLLTMSLAMTLLIPAHGNALRDAMLSELRKLAQSHLRDPTVREWMAKGLFNRLYHAEEENAPQLCDALLAEIRELARTWPEDPTPREVLGRALCNALQNATPKRREELLEELREMARNCPEETAARQYLAMGILNALNQAKKQGELDRRDALLEELRGLAQSWPQDAGVREELAKTLFNALNQAEVEGALRRHDALLDELRELSRSWPQDTVVREWFAKALFNLLSHLRQEGVVESHDAIVDELRELSRRWPQDAAVRQELAMGLFNAMKDAEERDALDRRDALLDELRELARGSPEDASVREWLTRGLLTTLTATKQLEPGRQVLIEELSELMQRYPSDPAVIQISELLESIGR